MRDTSGQAIAGAAIRLTSVETGTQKSAESNGDGLYEVLGLRPGSYRLQATKPQFRDFERTGITLTLGARVEADARLDVGTATQGVTVNEETSPLDTVTGTVHSTVSSRETSTLPLDGRNYIPLIALAPGVALPGGGSLLPRINGSRPRTNEYIYDGISALQPEPGQVVFYPIVDGIEEFRLEINSYSPEFGRSNGGAVLVNTKSGTNEFHGVLFEYLRNDKLNGRNYFSTPGPKPEYRRNQYGLAVGGPVQQNKTFFFVDWQGTRQRQAVPRISTVPTLAQRSGIFSNAVYDPVTHQQFAGNRIPVSRFDPLGAAVLARYPLPTSSAAANNYVRSAVEPDDQDQFDVRLDRYFGEKHRTFARFTEFRDDDTPVTPLPDGSGSITSGLVSPTTTRGYQGVVEYQWTIRPTLLNQFRFGYTRRDSNSYGPANGGLTVPGLPANSFSSALPTFTVTGEQQIGPSSGANSRFGTSVTEYVDTVSLVRGAHTIRIGTDIRREALRVVQPANPAGTYNFTTTGSTSASGGGGNAIASLLLGQVGTFSIDLQERPLQERAHIAEFFVADDWRLSQRLSLNFGTRYTLNFPSTEVNGQGAVFNLNTQVLDFPKTARDLECCDFGPRVGVAYRALEKTVLRAGYGLVWFEQTGITTPFTLPQFPFVQTLGQQSLNSSTAAFTLSQGPSVQPTTPNPNSGLGQGVFGTQRDNGSGYSQQWNFTVEQQIGADLNFEIGYLGSKNTRLGLPEANLNQLPVQDLALGGALDGVAANPYFGQIPASSSLGRRTITQQQLLRPYPRFTSVALFRNNVGSSSYHALQTKVERRLGRGLTLSAAYTWSKLIDDASSYFSQTIFTGPVLNNTGAADANNRHLERDVSTGDIPHVFSVGWVYSVPRVWRISGVQVAGIVRLQSGDAVAVSQANNLNSAYGFAVQRPNRVSNPNEFAGRTPEQWFNTAAFTGAPRYTIGNSSRNPVRGPSQQNADLMVSKIFRFNERLGLEARGEVFNVTNTPPLNDPNGSFGAAAFGSITSAGNPRDFEFALRLNF